MYFDVPVVAFASSSAVPDTLADAGVLLPEKDPVVVAAAVDRVVNDSALRSDLVEAGRARVDHYSLKNSGQTMLDAITGFLNG